MPTFAPYIQGHVEIVIEVFHNESNIQSSDGGVLEPYCFLSHNHVKCI